ncbi:virB3 type IV secretion protein [Helicobacter sp. 12S02232-10]|uniref:virB3 type IV secretion protein n=1 Tax=Helicobacter sp. 12S02232-10 TaxID=1476197 RepID=UPI000BA796AF|nr:virB3 type IV secretion protein [Helicobacter sp. 12S02232-10]PAF49450.1 virB3 type IV secretion protein [Helicobacter sp. 12S02232-10]
MLQVTNVEVPNIRELTKKEKLLGLNFNSWVICSFAALALANYSFLFALLFFICAIVSFYVAEFFDEDITDILFASFLMKTDIKIYYA